MRVDELMSRNVRTIGIDEGCDQALSQMLRWKVRHLPVLDGVGSLRGVLTDRDLRHQLFDPAVQERIGRTPTMLLLKERPVEVHASEELLRDRDRRRWHLERDAADQDEGRARPPHRA